MEGEDYSNMVAADIKMQRICIRVFTSYDA